MIGIQNSKACNIEKPIPGCLGRMVNLFDLSTGMVATNRLLTEKPHCDGDTLGSSLPRSRSDVAKMASPIGDPIEDKQIVSELRTSSNKKSNRKPIKMLIAQEMSKEVEAKHNPPNVVAKLMGLDTLPQRQLASITQRKSHSRSFSCDNNLIHARTQMQSEVYQSIEQSKYKDVYDWQQSQRSNNSIRDKSPQKRRCNNTNLYDNKMSLVRQKFIEAKRLATDENQRQSKEFQDALEVLSSNKDLFLKFLQEPDSVFSQNFYEVNDSSPPSPETKRITVLRPTKMVGDENEETQRKKQSHLGKANEWHQNLHELCPNSADWRSNEIPNQPTRIVVLKPILAKTHDLPSLSPTAINGEYLYEELEDEARESREVAKEITRKIRENLSGHHREETVLSSVFSNGYVGDESSFDKSENAYEAEIHSDSEVISPISRHSWDYINRFSSPFSSASFSRASFSPESSVCREAKKRLSQRWALMAMNGTSQEQKNIRRSSSTLGEMLALSETKKSDYKPEEEDINKNEEPRVGTISCLTDNLYNQDDTCVNLSRSKSLPVSSTVCAGLNVEIAGPEVGKTSDSKELTMAKSMKTSFTGKVSKLLFSKNKKSSAEKLVQSRSKAELQATTSESLVTPVLTYEEENGVPKCVDVRSLEKGYFQSSIGKGSKQGIAFEKAIPLNSYENPNHPSPISVLEPPFNVDDNKSSMFSSSINPNLHGTKGSVHLIKSNLIDKSPPIESISRTLSREIPSDETSTSFPFKSSLTSPDPDEEQDICNLVQSLLSISGLDIEANHASFLCKWHSPESPLGPLLREKYIHLDDKEYLQETKRRHRRSTRKLVFDCVNAALLDVTGYGSEISHKGKGLLVESHNCLVDRVLSWVKAQMLKDNRANGDNLAGDGYGVVVERVVSKELTGKMWSDRMVLEMDNVEKEIEKKLLEELVEEAVVELTGKLYPLLKRRRLDISELGDYSNSLKHQS